ncbi:NUDIX domain-containing protein [Candidatus Woesearchaeota archaeon]|nr:MAG: NUDIX domain-containing protein [Candidatus Woesearchaeota archaeon]
MIPKDEYARILRQMPIVCIDVIAQQGDVVFFVKRRDEPAKGEWWFPGGRLRKGEELHHAAQRKLLDETGLYLHDPWQVGTYSTVFETGPFGDPVHSVNVVFAGFAEGRIFLDETSTDYTWLKPQEYAGHPYVEKALRDAFKR